MASLQVLSAPPALQKEIERLISLQNQIRKLTKMFNVDSAAVLKRIQSGIPVEPGLHVAQVETIEEGAVQTTRLTVY